MTPRPVASRLAASFIAIGLLVLVQGAAWAGPGGIIKAAAETTFGKIVLLILTILLAPVIIYYAVRTAIHRRRTMKDLTRLAAALPQYRWLEVKDRVSGVFSWVWASWSMKDMEKASQFCTHWYWQNQQMLLESWEQQGLENVCRLQEIRSISPIFVQHLTEEGGEGSRIVVDIRARVVDYMRNKQTGQVVQGDEKVGDLETVWTFVWSDGAWKLNLIEPYTEEWAYLFMPNEVPAAAGEAAQKTA